MARERIRLTPTERVGRAIARLAGRERHVTGRWLEARLRSSAFAALIALGVVAVPGWASQATPSESRLEAEVRRVAGTLRCPVCQGVSVADSPDGLAVQMKEVIRQQLREGRSPQEVQAFFVSRYGEWILLQPEPRGFNLTVYVVPLLIMLAGGALLALRVRQWTQGDPAEGGAVLAGGGGFGDDPDDP